MWPQILLLSALLLVLSFGLVLLRGAPYLPTMRRQVNNIFELAELKEGSTIIELGCGDGRILMAAAKSGIKAVGYELNPLLYLFCLIRTRRFKDRIRVVYGDFWQKSWPGADAIYVFLLPRLMNKLERKIRAEGLERAKVISFAFRFSNLAPVKHKEGVYLYRFKA